jgi:hypothetical protein
MLLASRFEIVTFELRHLQLTIVEIVAIGLDAPNNDLVAELKAAGGQHRRRISLGPHHMMENIEPAVARECGSCANWGKDGSSSL